MRKKHCQSAEDFFSSSNKTSKEFRKNPRFPHKMKLSKTSASLKPFIPQNRNENSNPPATTCVVRSRSAYQDDTGEMLSWERLRTTFSNKNPLQAPYMNFPECMAGIPEKGEPLYSENCNSLCFPPQQKSSTAVQVNIDHCADCRRHRKYGKPLGIETNGSDCDSESSQAESVLPISVNKRLKPFTCRRSPKSRHKETCQQQQDDLCNEDDLEDTTEFMYECGHKTGKNEGDKDSDEASDIVQAQSDDEDEISSDPRSRGGILCSCVKKIFGRESPMANIQLVLSLLLLLSLILVLAHTNLYSILTTIGVPFKEEVPVPETYLHICLNYFNYLFSTSSFPEPFSIFTSLF